MNLSRIAVFWPGLPQLWYRSQWSALAYAMFFAAALNLALLSTFYWYQWYPLWLNRLLWFSVFTASIWSAMKSLPTWNSLVNPPVPANLDSRFMDAQRQYLQGNYIEAEGVLIKLLDRNPEDAEAMLLLGTICRRTKRSKQGLLWLQRTEMIERGSKWRHEISSERRMLLDQTQESLAANATNS